MGNLSTVLIIVKAYL